MGNVLRRILSCALIVLILIISTLSTLNFTYAQVDASLTVTKTGVPLTQSSPGTITWNITVENTG
ncbi:MAG: hypothetical protein P8Y18_07430, partial [Candidatus Bathyarchaeota archaeon]